MTRPDAQEAAVLEGVVPALQAEGFEVFVHPPSSLLPKFLERHQPDAIAVREGSKLLIEVVREGSASKQRLDTVRALLADHSDWDLRVYWVSPSAAPKSIQTVSREDLEFSLRTVKNLAKERQTSPALLMAWATFEALGRSLLPAKLKRAQTPGRLVEVLASDGQLTPSEADQLRKLADLRNQLIHGGLHVSVSENDLARFIKVLGQLFKQIPTVENQIGV